MTAFPTVLVAAIQANAVIVDAEGCVEEGFVEADCDLRVTLHAKRWFDSVGHYSREDVLGNELADRPEPVA